MAKRTHNLIAIVEHTSMHIPLSSVDGKVTSRELLDALCSKANVPAGTRPVLIRKLTRRQLLPNESLSDAGIGDGETLLADFERSTGGSLEFHPTGWVKSIQTEPEKTPCLSDILHEISRLHQVIESLDKQLAAVTAEIRDIKDSIIIVSGQDNTAESHMELTDINKPGDRRDSE